MENQFSLFNLLVLIGITQGVITSTLLLLSKKNSRSNRFLAMVIIAFCLLSTKILLHTLNLWNTVSLRYFPIGIELALAPSLYFYITSLINPKFKLGRKDLFHFIPFVISQCYSMYVYFSVVGIPEIEQKDLIANSLWFNDIKTLEDYLAFLSLMIYLPISYIKLQKYRQWLNNNVSDNTFPSFNWLKNIFISSIIISVLFLINLFLDGVLDFGNTYFFHWQVFFIFIAALIYYLGFIGYKQPSFQILEIEKNTHSIKASKLPNDKVNEIAKALEKVLTEDKVFLNPTISSLELAKLLGISQSNLSYVVNNSLHKSFRDLINEHRINEVKSKLNDIKYSHMSILGIALECGFNSEASFYRIFKKNTGLSPKEYALLMKNS